MKYLGIFVIILGAVTALLDRDPIIFILGLVVGGAAILFGDDDWI